MSGGRVIWALVRRALNEITRVPGAVIPGALAPTIFMLGLSSVFGAADRLPGFDAPNFRSFVLPVGFLQGAGFAGAATGVNLARDIEQGWFDRLLLSPTPRLALLAGVIGSASLRSLIPATVLLGVGLALDVSWPGLAAVALAVVLIAGFAAVSACWGTIVALRLRTQQAAPIMQVGSFAAVLFTTSYAPKELLSDWLSTVATVNPVTHVLEGLRQGFVGDVTWTQTWPALIALAGLLVFFGGLALRGLRRVDA